MEEGETLEEQGVLVVEQEEPPEPLVFELVEPRTAEVRIEQPHSASETAPQPHVQAIPAGPAIMCATSTGPTRVRIARVM